MKAAIKLRTEFFRGHAMHYCTGELPDGRMHTATDELSKERARALFDYEVRRTPKPITKGKKP